LGDLTFIIKEPWPSFLTPACKHKDSPLEGRDEELPDGPELRKLKGVGIVGVEDGMGLVGDPIGFRDVVSSVEMVGLGEGYANGPNVRFIDGSPEGFVVGAFDGADGFGCAH
jgi:hypothetical protein